MAWDDKAPSKNELSKIASWDDSPPTNEELNLPDISELESGIRGASQGLTFGFAPAIEGAANTIPEALNALTGGSKLQDVVDAYNRARKASNDQFKAAETINPKSYLAGQIGGALATAPLLPEVSGITGATKLGAGIGALSGLGQSVSEGDDLGESVKNIASQGAMGGLIGAAGGSINKLISSLTPESLEQMAAERAVKSTGATKAQTKNLLNATTLDENSQNRLIEQGKNLLSNNPYTETPIVTMGASPETILERAQELEQKSGKDISDILSSLDSKYSTENPEIRDLFFNPKTLVDQVEDLQSQFTKNGEVIPLYKSEYNKLQDVLDTINQYGDQPIDFSEAQKLKQTISQTAYNDEGKLQDQLLGQVRGMINDGIENSADQVAKASGDENLFNKYITAKDLYRTSKDAQLSSTGKVAGNLVNRDLGITDYMTGIAGAVTHGLPGGLVASGAHKVINTYANTMLASGGQSVANGFRAMGKAFTSVNPVDLASFGKTLISSGDPLSTKLGHVLVSASEKDNIGRNALIFSLLQNPSYREMMHNLIKDNK